MEGKKNVSRGEFGRKHLMRISLNGRNQSTNYCHGANASQMNKSHLRSKNVSYRAIMALIEQTLIDDSMQNWDQLVRTRALLNYILMRVHINLKEFIGNSSKTF